MAKKKNKARSIFLNMDLAKGARGTSKRISNAVEIGVRAWEKRRRDRDLGLMDIASGGFYVANRLSRELISAPNAFIQTSRKKRGALRIAMHAFGAEISS